MLTERSARELRRAGCRITVFVVWVLALVAGACGADDTTTTGPTTAGPTTAGPTTALPASTTSEPPMSTDPVGSSTGTSTTAATTLTTTSPAAGPDYVVGGPQGVFRVVDGQPTLVIDRPDVAWAADDGMGGVIYYAEPGVIERLPVGATAPVGIATDATPNFVTLIEGTPTLAITQIQRGECDDADSQHSVVVDLATGEHRFYAPCIPLESSGIHPRSIGGDISVAVAGGGWPDEEPLSARLVFRPGELPSSITTLAGWDEEALRLLGELELDLAANPWPEPCRWCAFDVRLSRDGTTLALTELVPSPADLGATDWDTFDALDLVEQWRRWEDLQRTADIRLRIIDLERGDIRYSANMAGPGSLVDYDGRYLIYRFEGPGHHGQFPLNTHLIDTTTGEEIPINWGTTDTGHQQASIALALAD